MVSDLSAMSGHRYAPQFEPNWLDKLDTLLSTRVGDLFGSVADAQTQVLAIGLAIGCISVIFAMGFARRRAAARSRAARNNPAPRFLRRADAQARLAALRDTSTQLEVTGAAGHYSTHRAMQGPNA
ncbi:hypothetical protein [Tropicimonas isoalkanivorans]|uniref:Uncharacterized protein n=1 Tax=Tropicimonas isoalkanivorans TaxID=441112 RepID=A0A1I1K8B7_9RHOB|nr:hypothetical protein [Tropicimonas isoalkanivorans]SFC57094.1 hypothetical protein SAMN04488094_106105 [Tropicimonas isoalkanivorans]